MNENKDRTNKKSPIGRQAPSNASKRPTRPQGEARPHAANDRDPRRRMPPKNGDRTKGVPPSKSGQGRAVPPHGQNGGKAQRPNGAQDRRSASSFDIGALIEGVKSRMTPKIAVLTAVGVVAFAFIVCMLVNILIGVRSIEVVGNDLASADEIASVAGIETGSGYFSYNTGRSEKTVLQNIQCISEIKISRSVFGKVKITVTEKKALWYIEVYGEYYALSDSLEVIRHSDMRDGFIAKGLIRLDFPEVKSAILGKTVEYADEGRDCSFVPEFLANVTESQFYKDGRIDQVAMEDKFNIFIVCDMKYKIRLGKHQDTPTKLSSVETVIANLDGTSPYEIGASDVNNITAFEDPKLDFSYLKPLLGG